MSNHLEQWRAVWFQAVARAWKDETFKRALLRDARVAIRENFHYELPPNMTLRVVESRQTPELGCVEFALPPKPAHDADEAEQLAEISRELANAPVVCAC